MVQFLHILGEMVQLLHKLGHLCNNCTILAKFVLHFSSREPFTTNSSESRYHAWTFSCEPKAKLWKVLTSKLSNWANYSSNNTCTGTGGTIRDWTQPFSLNIEAKTTK